MRIVSLSMFSMAIIFLTGNNCDEYSECSEVGKQERCDGYQYAGKICGWEAAGKRCTDSSPVPDSLKSCETKLFDCKSLPHSLCGIGKASAGLCEWVVDRSAGIDFTDLPIGSCMQKDNSAECRNLTEENCKLPTRPCVWE